MRNGRGGIETLKVEISNIDVDIHFVPELSVVRLESKDGQEWSFQVDDPFDMIHDIFVTHADCRFYFENAHVRYYVPIANTSPEYVIGNPDLVYNDSICIYSGTFPEAISLMICDTPVHQHYYRYLQLFVNACAYLRTMQQV